jgi:RES domain-containing protein
VATRDREHVDRGGRVFRVADPDWEDPLDSSFAAQTGGRWNPPDSFGVLYLNDSVAVARANVERLYAGLPYAPEDLENLAAPILLDLDVPVESYADATTDKGLVRLGLPTTYPHDSAGRIVQHSICQPIGQAVHADAELGVACRSAAVGAEREELAWFELAWFELPSRPRPTLAATKLFEEWFWAAS